MRKLSYRVIDLTASPDAELLALMRQIKAAEQSMVQRCETLHGHGPQHPKHAHNVREADAAIARYHQLALNACDIPARTDQGRAAKARLLQSFNDHLGDDGTLDGNVPPFVRIAHSLSLDLAGPLPV